jgi:hypothetical protein
LSGLWLADGGRRKIPASFSLLSGGLQEPRRFRRFMIRSAVFRRPRTRPLGPTASGFGPVPGRANGERLSPVPPRRLRVPPATVTTVSRSIRPTIASVATVAGHEMDSRPGQRPRLHRAAWRRSARARLDGGRAVRGASDVRRDQGRPLRSPYALRCRSGGNSRKPLSGAHDQRIKSVRRAQNWWARPCRTPTPRMLLAHQI